MNQTSDSSPKNKQLKHCREWVETTLLMQTDGKTLAVAGLLAGETLLLSAVSLWSLAALIMFKGSLLQRLAMILKSLVPWLPVIALCTLLSLAGAQLAQWGERRYQRGRLAAIPALVPVMPLLLAVFFRPSLIPIAPVLGIGSIWLLGSIWWQLFCFFLRRLATFDYWAQLERESKPQDSDWLYEHRSYLETKKTALLERKLRWENMASSNPEPAGSGTHQPQHSSQEKAPVGHQLVYRWAIPMIIGSLLAGLALWQYRSRVPPEIAVTPEPPSLVFWYQVPQPEASLLQDLVLAYNAMADKQGIIPAVEGNNQVGDFPLQIYRAQITGKTPDVMLVSEELANQLSSSWGRHIGAPNLDTLETSSTKSSTGFFTPLWPDRLWRQRLVLVISPATKLQGEAEAFTSYLHSKLSDY